MPDITTIRADTKTRLADIKQEQRALTDEAKVLELILAKTAPKKATARKTTTKRRGRPPGSKNKPKYVVVKPLNALNA